MPWKFDSNLSKVVCAVGYLGLTELKAVFRNVQADLDLNGDSPLDWKVKVTIGADSFDAGHPRMEEHVRSADFLGVEQFPTIEFISRGVDTVSASDGAGSGRSKPPGVTAWHPRDDHFRLLGDLTLHGVTRPIQMDVRYLGEATDPRGVTRRAFTAETSLNRSDYGIHMPPQGDPLRTVAGEQVRLNILVIATRTD